MDRARAALATLKTNPDAIAAVYEAVCRDIVQHVGSTRASVWALNGLQDTIHCSMLFDSRDGSLQSGTKLDEDSFPEYFAAIKRDLRIVAADAASHPATSCFDEVYFTPLDIRSLLDVCILIAGQPVAVLCCEHCGVIKDWTASDVQYLETMAALLSVALKQQLKKAA
ncbi:MAG: GAF domain-containing protein [Gemmatimonadaceae bacterium]|nr:GAF domain-containing protein [Gemmatimonadaceae bacterium]